MMNADPRDPARPASLRMRLRRGDLARLNRPDPSGDSETREPEELVTEVEESDTVGNAPPSGSEPGSPIAE